MALKTFSPTSPGIRHAVLIDRSELTAKKPFKGLVGKIKVNAARNNQGKITVRHQSGGSKKLFRDIDLKRTKKGIPGIIETIEYDPYRTAFISLVKYPDGSRRYVLATNGIKVGETIVDGETAEIKAGNSLPLSKIPQGTSVHSVELYPNTKASLARSAGSFVQVMGGDKGYVQLRLPSGEIRLVKETCYATIGILSNIDNGNQKLGKAGRSRRMGVRPSVRGVAMSIKHPHGGGQGKSGRHGTGGPKSDVYGNLVGTRTRKDRKITSKFIIQRRAEKNKFKKYKTVI